MHKLNYSEIYKLYAIKMVMQIQSLDSDVQMRNLYRTANFILFTDELVII